MIKKPNTPEEMIIVLSGYLAGKELEFACVAPENEMAGIGDYQREWAGCRNDIPAHELFNFKTHAYRAV